MAIQEESRRTESLLYLRKTLESLALVCEADEVSGVDEAEDLGIWAVTVGIFEPMYSGVYNIRVPYGGEREALLLGEVSSLTILCPEPLSYDAAASLGLDIGEKSDAVLTQVGGAVQPEQQRFQLNLDLVEAFHLVNPEADINLVGHEGVCCGADISGRGRELVLQFFEALVQRGINPERLWPLLAVMRDNRFAHFEQLR